MLRYCDYDIVFQEIPDEVTLAVNITNCPNRCPGCHSQWLWDDIGHPLSNAALCEIADKYASAITCLCFMGGDNEPEEVMRLAKVLRNKYPDLKIGWYSGKQELPPAIPPTSFDYIKLGPYIETLGPLTSPTTNQRLFSVDRATGTLTDITRVGVCICLTISPSQKNPRI